MLKRRLETFAEDLKTMIDQIDLLLMNQYDDYRLRLTDEQIRYSLNLRKKIYQQIASYITHYALRKIAHQYDLLTKRSTIIEACSNVFIIITEMPCSHRIQKRLYEEEKVILLKNVHSH